MPPINPYAYQYPPMAPTFQPYQQPLVQAAQSYPIQQMIGHQNGS